MKTKINLNHKTIYTLYWKENKSLPQIGKAFNVNSGNLYRWMKRNNIPTRSKKESALLRRKITISRSKLYELYWKNKLTQKEIGKLFNATSTAILYWMKKFNIKRRSPKEVAAIHTKIKRPPTSKLLMLYHHERKSITQIAREFGVFLQQFVIG